MSGHGQPTGGWGVGGEGDAPARASFERQHDASRVLALSDGVFAIIITLLVQEYADFT